MIVMEYEAFLFSELMTIIGKQIHWQKAFPYEINTEEGWSAMRFQSLSNRYFLML